MLIKLFYKCLIISFINSEIFAELIDDYFNYKNVPVATVFACSTKDYIKIMKSIMNSRTVASGQRYLDRNMSFSHLMHSPYYRMGVYLDYTCEFGKNVIKKSSTYYLLNSSYVWFIQINSTDELNKFKKYNFGLDSDAVAVVNSEVGDEAEFYDLYKINSTWPLITTLAGSWSSEHGLDIILNDTIVQRRSDFQGITLIGTYVLSVFKFNYTKEDLDKLVDHSYKPHLDALSRMTFIIFIYLGEIFNFTLSYNLKSSWGYPNQKGPILHDGMMGDIERRIIDIGMSPCTMAIMSRMDIAHFANLPVWYFRCFFIFRHPRTLGTYRALVVPFSLDVWILTISLIFVIGILLSCIKRFSVVKVDTETNTPLDQTVSGNVVIAIGAIFQQGLPSCSGRIPERIVLFFTLLVGVMICTFYNSMIVTSLLQPPPKYINTPRQLMESSFKLILQNYPYIKHLFTFSKDPVIHKMLVEKMKGNPTYAWPSDGMNVVQHSEVAFYADESYIYKIAEEEFNDEDICSLQEIDLERPVLLQIPLKRNSPLREFISHGLLMMKETGIIYRQSKIWNPRKPHCQGQTAIPAVEISSVLVAFMVFLCGLGLSVVLLLTEILHYKFNKKIKKVHVSGIKKLHVLHND